MYCSNWLGLIKMSLQCLICSVAPPSDVVLHCGNLVNKVAWRYDNPPMGLRYRVDIGKVFNSQGFVFSILRVVNCDLLCPGDD